MLAASEFALSSAAFHGRRAAAPSEMGSGLWRWTEMPERSPASPKSFDCQMALETYCKRRPEGRRFTRTAAARNVSNVTIRVFGKGANRCAGSAAAGYVLVTQTFPQAHKQHHSSEPCCQYPELPDKSPAVYRGNWKRRSLQRQGFRYF